MGNAPNHQKIAYFLVPNKTVPMEFKSYYKMTKILIKSRVNFIALIQKRAPTIIYNKQ